MIYHLYEHEDGKTTLAALPDEGFAIRLVPPPGSAVVTTHRLNITHEEFQTLCAKAATHHVKFDTMTGSIMLESKKPPKSEAHP
jgi:hypothetical protein